MPRPREQPADHLLDVALQPPHLAAGGRIVLEEALAQAGHAEGDAAHPDGFAVLHQYQLDAPAADVDQEIRAALEAERVARGAEDEAGLLRAGDDAHGEAGLAPEP